MKNMKSFSLLLSVCLLAVATSGQPVHQLTSRNLSANHKSRLTVAKVMPVRKSDAQPEYQRTDIEEITNSVTTSENRLVDVTAEVIAIDARQQSISLFDARSKKMLQVSISQLPKAMKRSLMFEPIHEASVLGRVEKRNGKIQVVAHQIIPRPSGTSAETPVSF